MQIFRHNPPRPGAQELRRLIDRYLEASTTLDEERRLFAAFASGCYPHELEPYAEMFADCATLAGRDAKHCSPSRSRRTLRIVLAAAVGTAAAAALCVIIANNARNAGLQRMYGGSYIIVDGRRNDNLHEIMPQIKSTLAEAAAIERELDGRRIADDIKNDMLNGITDPSERERVKRLINK